MAALRNIHLQCLIVGFLLECPLSVGTPKKRALVLGGTQFMGRWTVERLMAETYSVTVFNRGETPYPWPKKLVARLKADRYNNREKFTKLLKKSVEDEVWDVIVDFTAFHENALRDAVSSLYHNGEFSVKHYIYIGTDSVYWNLKLPDDDSGLNETSAQAFSIEEYTEHEKYLNKTQTGQYQKGYGGNKLSCDVFLQKVFKDHSFPFTSFRLPDVYGPYDNLGGFWNIVNVVKQSGRLPAGLPHGRIRPRGSGKALSDSSKHKVTWVFVADVVDAIMAVIEAGVRHAPSVGRSFRAGGPFGEVFHIAHEEAVSLQDAASLIFNVAKASPKLRHHFSADGAKLDYDSEAEVPTTDFGALDVTKAARFLQWRPRPMREAVQVSLEWYFGGQKGYPANIAIKDQEL